MAVGCQPYAPAAFTPRKEYIYILILQDFVYPSFAASGMPAERSVLKIFRYDGC